MSKLGLIGRVVGMGSFGLIWCVSLQAQSADVNAVTVPHYVQYSGTALTDASAGASVSIRFALYSAQTGGEAVWSESQQVMPDSNGRYSVLLGSDTQNGLPQQVFSSGEARWLGVSINSGQEGPRTILVATPYALKASDAQTLGGHPVSDFALARNNAHPDATAVTQVNAGTGITVSGNGTGTVTVGINATYLDSLAANYAPLHANNTFTGNQTINGNASVSGTLTISGAINSPYLDSLAAQVPTLKGTNTFSGANTFNGAVGITGSSANAGILAVSNTNANGYGIVASGTGVGVKASASNTVNGAAVEATGAYYGTYATGTAVGSFAQSPIVGVSAETSGTAATNYGLYASAPAGKGSAIYAVNGSPSNGSYSGAAIWADTSETYGADGGNVAALLATAQDNFGAIVANNSAHPSVYASNTGAGYGVSGYANSGAGVYGFSASGTGVYGTTNNAAGGAGVFGTANGFGSGLEGTNPSTQGYGIYAQAAGASTTGSFFTIGNYGSAIWADTAADYSDTFSFAALIATADDNHSAVFENHSDDETTISVINASGGATGNAVPLMSLKGSQGACGVNGAGDVTCSGRMKTAVAAGGKQVAVYGVTSAENWVEDFGSGKLENGHAVIAIDPKFAEIVNTGVDYHVFLTPQGECEGLYVTGKSAKGFEVRELHHGSSAVSFDYRIVAKRAGLENERLADITAEMERFQRTPESDTAKQRAARAAMPVRNEPTPDRERPTQNAEPMKMPSHPAPPAARAAMQRPVEPATNTTSFAFQPTWLLRQPCSFARRRLSVWVRRRAGAPARYNKSFVATAFQPALGDLVQIDTAPRRPASKPEWLKARAPVGENFHALKKLARDLNLHTVCESAHCPNIGECWNHKTATFMMLGNLCTRRCGFCAVLKGRPEAIDHDEPRRVAEAVAALGLKHAVITSVNRDDDILGGARAFVTVIEEIRAQAPGCQVEVLTPDFQGREDAIKLVVNAKPEVLNHNTETVPRLYRAVRSGSKYGRSLRFLEYAKHMNPVGVTKSGVMVGLGETMDELMAVARDLANVGVDILTIGQYLRPSKDHLPMARIYTPAEFADMKTEAMTMGFRHVESGPLVRSSYHAHEQAASTGLALLQ